MAKSPNLLPQANFSFRICFAVADDLAVHKFDLHSDPLPPRAFFDVVKRLGIPRGGHTFGTADGLDDLLSRHSLTDATQYTGINVARAFASRQKTGGNKNER